MAQLILVDELDRQVGTADKSQCHSGAGMLHRAFTILILSSRREVLIQRRSGGKPLWPGVWETSCSGHPTVGEEMVEAAGKRLREELGISTELEVLGKFQYQAPYDRESSENEICSVLYGQYDGEVSPDPKEVSGLRWSEIGELKRAIEERADEYAPWLAPGLEVLCAGRGKGALPD